VSEARKTTCRYLKAFGHQCTGEAVDPDAEILLCVRHLAEAQRLIASALSGKASAAAAGAPPRRGGRTTR
jgi:hypothetical protein